MVLNKMAQIQLQGPVPSGRYADVDLNAEICCDGFKTQVKGFYAGNGIYKVRFLPVREGTVSWKVTGVVEASGTEECTASEQYHGLVQTKGTHFQYADGTPFYPFGTTIYAMLHQEEELIERTLEQLGESPFNKVRLCIFPKDYDYNHDEPGLFPFERKKGGGWETGRPCPAFWDKLDRLLDRLEQAGIQADLILFHPYDRWGFAELSREERLLYLETVVRRLAARPNVWWSLANEYDAMYYFSPQDWYTIEEWLASADVYHHLMSNHNWALEYDFARKNITHVSLQSHWVQRVSGLIQSFQKPVIYDEMGYEGNLPFNWGNLSAFEMVNRFWCVCAQGGYGTHGETFEAEDESLWWSKGGSLTGESVPRICWLREILEEMPGPIEPLPEPAASFELFQDRKFVDGLIEGTPVRMRGFVRSITQLSKEELDLRALGDARYQGCCGEDAYLFYYARTCPGRVEVNLPEHTLYQIEILDVWKMTRQTAAMDVCGRVEVKLPCREGIAVLATKR